MSKNILGRISRYLRLKRYAKSDDGAVAMEFAFIAIPFFYIVMAVLETSVVYFAETNLGTSVETASRQIRVGTFGAGLTGDEKKTLFIQNVCDNAVMVPDCENNLKVDVQVITTFADANSVSSIAACLSGADPDDFSVTEGTGSALMLVRVCYDWQLITPFMSQVFSYPAGSGSRTLSSVQAFRNEPFDAGGGGGA